MRQTVRHARALEHERNRVKYERELRDSAPAEHGAIQSGSELRMRNCEVITSKHCEKATANTWTLSTGRSKISSRAGCSRRKDRRKSKGDEDAGASQRAN